MFYVILGAGVVAGTLLAAVLGWITTAVMCVAGVYGTWYTIWG